MPQDSIERLPSLQKIANELYRLHLRARQLRSLYALVRRVEIERERERQLTASLVNKEARNA